MESGSKENVMNQAPQMIKAPLALVSWLSGVMAGILGASTWWFAAAPRVRPRARSLLTHS
ncbi:hypothetical protein CO2235_150115 [Cupriavidus oxalaticus]|uniref:Uncharacterized protein n=2 Tax=Cupriavidus oxalaticus TaxID=96344 RepID=A0A375FYT2_9BURK|nr:hypothetical protein CO2235_150115 [Cupriavidus oxalaticus]